MRVFFTTVLFALSTSAFAGGLRASAESAELAPESSDSELSCIYVVDAEGYEDIVCGEPVDDLGGSTEQITARDCARQGGTLAQPYTSQGDYGWYCVGLFLGAPPSIR